jgi:hypothetical protein
LEDEDVHKTDVLAEFADPEECLISSVDLDACTRPGSEPILPERDRDGRLIYEYVATMDPATRGNAWTLKVTECSGRNDDGLPKYRVMLARDWIGTKVTPLSPKTVLREISEALAPYEVRDITTDQWSADAMRDLAALPEIGLSLREVTLDSDNRLQMAKTVAMVLRTRRLELPTHKHLRTDLLLAKNRVTQNGATLVLPRTGDGRHCDFLIPLMFAMARPPEPPEEPEPPPPHGDFQDVIDRLDGGSDGWGQVFSVLM